MLNENIIQNISTLIRTLAAGAVEPHDAGLYELRSQASNLCLSTLDHDEAAIQAGWTADNIGVWRHLGEKSVFSEIKYAASAEEACEISGVDPYEWEIYEHWIITERLAVKLEKHGERVDFDFAEMCVWGRTTTGQAISMDDVILKITKDY